MKCLLVAGEMLKQLSLRRPSPILLTLVDSLVHHRECVCVCTHAHTYHLYYPLTCVPLFPVISLSLSVFLLLCLCLCLSLSLFAPSLPPSHLMLSLLQLLPCIQNENPCVRDLALSALGLACLLDVSLARSHILLFVQASAKIVLSRHSSNRV